MIARAARATLRPVVSPWLRRRGFEVRGPAAPAGPHIVACNHPSLADTLYLWAAFPGLGAVVGARPHHFRSWRRPLLALGDVRCIPDEEAFHAVGGELLRSGSPILAYPERTRRPDGLGPFLPWVARLALRAGVPILPCRLRGTAPGDVGPVVLAIGDPMAPSGNDAALTAALRAAIVALETR